MSKVCYWIGYLATWVLAAGWTNARLQYEASISPWSSTRERAAREHRSDFGFAILWTAGMSILWPITLSGLLILGWYQDGWTLRVKPRVKPDSEVLR